MAQYSHSILPPILLPFFIPSWAAPPMEKNRSVPSQFREMPYQTLHHLLNNKGFVLRTSRGEEGHVVLALSFIKHLNGRDLGNYTIRESGATDRQDTDLLYD